MRSFCGLRKQSRAFFGGLAAGTRLKSLDLGKIGDGVAGLIGGMIATYLLSSTFPGLAGVASAGCRLEGSRGWPQPPSSAGPSFLGSAPSQKICFRQKPRPQPQKCDATVHQRTGGVPQRIVISAKYITKDV
jgi:hypothetical protein